MAHVNYGRCLSRTLLAWWRGFICCLVMIASQSGTILETLTSETNRGNMSDVSSRLDMAGIASDDRRHLPAIR